MKTASGYQQQLINNYPNNLSKLRKSLFQITEDIEISFQIFDFVLQNFVLFFWDFNGSNRKEDLQMFVLKSEEKMMKNVHGRDQF